MNKYILSSHIVSDGPSQALRDYLIKNGRDFLWISHPLFYKKGFKGSGFVNYLEGEKKKEEYFRQLNLFLPLKYLMEIFLNILFVLRLKNHRQYEYIGYDNLNAFSGVILKKIGAVKKSIYYVVDYTPRRFDNSLLNYIYHKIDQFCVKYCDETWSLNEKVMNAARKKFYNFDAYKKGYSIQKEVPMGYWGDRLELLQYSNLKKNQIVFLGTLLEKQGVQYVLKAFPVILKKLPNTKFVIVGGGEYEGELKDLSVNLGIMESVDFKGFLKNLEDAEKVLLESVLAIAIYEEGNPEKNFTYYTDPGKIKNYLGCGLPILISNVPPIAVELDKNKCGAIIGNNPEDIAEKVVELLSDGESLKKYRENVLEYRKQFDWDYIFREL
ncbi:MAG: hypothetical protein MNSN_06590 [Minisyncoccus archaeiphilus]|nr:MAG: hypothetical protein MNSN_06590 [Candidatus Parcubacteria bacterium]